MHKAILKKDQLEADLKTLLGIEDPNSSQQEKIDRIQVVLTWINNYIETCKNL